MNRHGEYGSDHSTNSTFGTGPYAGLHGAFSPCNWTLEAPPKIYIDNTFVAYLTENENISLRIFGVWVGCVDRQSRIKGNADKCASTKKSPPFLSWKNNCRRLRRDCRLVRLASEHGEDTICHRILHTDHPGISRIFNSLGNCSSHSDKMKQTSPTVELLISLDTEYREKAAAGKLKLIASKKLNPEGKAWLPIMNVQRDGWRFTIVFSNTQGAYDLGETNDWVVIYFDDGSGEQKCTVVTEHQGELMGKRVVRGREKECVEFHGISP